MAGSSRFQGLVVSIAAACLMSCVALSGCGGDAFQASDAVDAVTDLATGQDVRLDSTSDPDIASDAAEILITQENIASAGTTLEAASAVYSAGLSEGDEASAVDSTVTYLESQADVTDVFVSGDKVAVYYTQAPGIRCMILFKPMFLNDSQDVTLPTASLRSLVPGNVPRSAGTAGKALVFAPLADAPGFKKTHVNIKSMLESGGFDVDMFENGAATPMVVKDFGQYDVIYMRAHGGLDDGVFNFMTGMTTDTTGLMPGSQMVPFWLANGWLGLGKVAGSPNVYYTVYPVFFHDVTFREGSFAYLSSCHGLETTTLASKLNSRGLDAYVGWSQIIESDHEDGYTNLRLFERLLMGASLGAAFNELNEEDSDIADGLPKFGHSYGDLNGKAPGGVVPAAASFYPESAAIVRITLTGCDSEADCPQSPNPQICVSHQCSEVACVPDCTGLECGPDPVCGLSCGTCDVDENCNTEGTCVAKVPVCPGAKDCTGLVCGLDPVCGVSCGTCNEGYSCQEGECIEDACVPACGTAVCGMDPVCGQSCGTCDDGYTCQSGECVEDACVPACGTAVCGMDPVCGTQNCGTCGEGYSCDDGECVEDTGWEPDDYTVSCTNGMCLIPSGSFWMGCNTTVDSQCNSDESPYHEVTLSGYYIDKTEVTVDDYADCVTAGACTAPWTASSYCNWEVSGKGNHPVNCVNWNQAGEYCTWAGKRLPTEAEWEKAARGTDGRKYPWGNEDATCEYAVMDDGTDNGCGTDSTWEVCGKSPAGDSPYGLCDMSGNVWEWVSDRYDSGYYTNSPASNPTGPVSGSYRVVRGGSFYNGGDTLRASNRYGAHDPSGDDDYLGFRCARPQ